MIKITPQLNSTECAICVITSLHNYFFRKEIDKHVVLEKSQLNHCGLNLYDFELLANNFGIDCDSFQIEWNEFRQLKINNYFVCLIRKKEGYQHYVICKKTKKSVYLYDSSNWQVETVSYSKFQEMFCQIIILVSKNRTHRSNLPTKAYHLMFLDVHFSILSLCLICLSFIFAFLGNNFIKLVLDWAIGSSSVENLFLLGINFLFLDFCRHIIDYILEIYSQKQVKIVTFLFVNKIQNILLIKNANFVEKTNQAWIIQFEKFVSPIVKYYVVQINRICWQSDLYVFFFDNRLHDGLQTDFLIIFLYC